MMTKSMRDWSRVAIMVLSIAGAAGSRAQSVWDGDVDGDWGNANNWAGNVLPAFGTDAIIEFHAAGATNLETFLGAARTLGTLNFNADVDTLTRIRLYSNDTGSGGANRAMNFAVSSGTAAINVAAGASGEIVLGVSGGNINLNSDLVLTHNGSGEFTISRVLQSTGAFTQEGAGTLVLSQANTFSGGFTLNSGWVRAGNNSAFGSGTLTLNGGKLSSGTAARTLANAFTLGGNLTLGDATYSGALTFGGAGTLTGNRTVTRMSQRRSAAPSATAAATTC